jgi:cytochrome d ubiquinol oxidase subunit I
MSDLLAARSQMAMSLGFHILFAVVGIGMPALMVIAEYRYHRHGDPLLKELAKRWAKGTAILFAVGAVSGTVLSFELGLLWPTFMEHAGGIIGMPFSLEGLAFFTEAIFLGIYLYAWDRISPRAHIAAGIVVAVSGALSGIFVVTANAWMNTPAGFTITDGVIGNVDPIAAMLNPAAFSQVLHMTLAAYAATGFATAGIHAIALLRDTPNKAFHRHALQIGLLVGVPASLLQPLSGDLSARQVAENQPVKFAAMEAHHHTGPMPFVIGGWPDATTGENRFAIEVPGVVSFAMTGDPNAIIPGLDAVPPADRPPVGIVHVAFQIMIACGVALGLMSAWTIVRIVRRRRGRGVPLPHDRWYLRALVFAAPLGFIAIEAGWTVTEVGRQPWIVQGIMRTADAVSPVPGLVVPFIGFTLLYIGLSGAVLWLLYRQILKTHVSATPRAGLTEELPIPARL